MPIVIDIIVLNEVLFKHRPELAERYAQGLLVLLDPQQTADIQLPDGAQAEIKKPDGSVCHAKIDNAETRHGVMAFFFKGMSQTEMPRGSEITWQK